MKPEDIKRLAMKKAKGIAKIKQDLRYQKVIARFVAEGLLEHNHIRARKCFITLADVLWAAEAEPRILEILPAILIKRPGIIAMKNDLPKDLALVLKGIRRARPEPDFRGVPADKYIKWIPRIGQIGKTPKVTKSFRFSDQDLAMLVKISKDTGLSETDVIRKGLAMIERTLD